MSHHSSDEKSKPFNLADYAISMDEMQKEMAGQFPHGKITPQDEGAVALQIGSENGRVVLQFPKPVKWIGFTREQALQIANSLIKHAASLPGEGPLTVRIPSGLKPNAGGG